MLGVGNVCERVRDPGRELFVTNLHLYSSLPKLVLLRTIQVGTTPGPAAVACNELPPPDSLATGQWLVFFNGITVRPNSRSSFARSPTAAGQAPQSLPTWPSPEVSFQAPGRVKGPYALKAKKCKLFLPFAEPVTNTGRRPVEDCVA